MLPPIGDIASHNIPMDYVKTGLLVAGCGKKLEGYVLGNMEPANCQMHLK